MKSLILSLILFVPVGDLCAMGSKKPAEKSESEETFCAMDVKECADGSFVSRDPKKNCEFKICASGDKPLK